MTLHLFNLLGENVLNDLEDIACYSNKDERIAYPPGYKCDNLGRCFALVTLILKKLFFAGRHYPSSPLQRTYCAM